MKKPAIPDLQGIDYQLRNVLGPMKENIEILTGRRGTPIAQLSTSPTNAELAAKVNELLTLLQNSG